MSPRFHSTSWILFILALSLFSLSGHAGLKKGVKAPEFSLKSLDGPDISLTQLRKKGYVMLIFWETECVYCFSHVRDFNRLHQQYHNKGLTLAAINIRGEHEMEVREYKKDNNLKYLLLTDRLKNIDAGEKYKVIGSPTIVMVSPKGLIVYYGHKIPDVTQWLKK